MRYELAGDGLCAAVESHGGELVSLRYGGTEYIWDGDPAYWPGRNPVLFPIVGNLKEDSVRFGAAACRMSRHGFARDCEFDLLEQGRTHVVLELRESGYTLERYPFPFALRVRHELTERGFSTSFRVENTGKGPMPFCIGAHTAFRCPLEQGERFEDYEVVFDRPERADLMLPVPEGLLSRGGREPFLIDRDRFALDRSLFARLDTLILTDLRSTGVSLRHRVSGRGVRLDFAGFPLLAFWTKEDAPFLCMEPWHGCAALDDESGEFGDKPYCVILAPGGTCGLGYAVSIL